MTETEGTLYHVTSRSEAAASTEFDANNLLEVSSRHEASDLILTVGAPPTMRVNDDLVAIGGTKLEQNDCEALLYQMLHPDLAAKFERRGEIDFAYSIPGVGRYRVNGFRQRGSVAIVARVIPPRIKTISELGLPDVVTSLARRPNGIILVTGPTGSGKTTTLAAMIDLINTERACHIVTLEDPIEYLHRHKRSIINQREIGKDTRTFTSGLRSALRENPDVILVGEMRDLETIAIAMTAAETGHLVLATLHTSDAAQTVDRVIDVFPPHQQDQIRIQLAATLQGILAQTLVLKRDGTARVAAFEILIATPAIRNLIREGKTYQIPTQIQTGGRFGMRTMEASLRELVSSGAISEDQYRSRLAHLAATGVFVPPAALGASAGTGPYGAAAGGTTGAVGAAAGTGGPAYGLVGGNPSEASPSGRAGGVAPRGAYRPRSG